jgi:hypothetical protein
MQNHLDIVRAESDRLPAEHTVAGALDFLVRVLRRLPAEERAGLLLKPTGENIVPYRGHLVSASRICYPDGLLVKLLTDVPTTNGPQWAEEDRVETSRYLPIDAPPAVSVGDRPGRAEMMKALEVLQAFYQAREGLQRPDGLWIDGHPDYEGIGTWVFDVYFGQRLTGRSPEEAAAEVRRQIEASDEWKTKHGQ